MEAKANVTFGWINVLKGLIEYMKKCTASFKSKNGKADLGVMIYYGVGTVQN